VLRREVRNRLWSTQSQYSIGVSEIHPGVCASMFGMAFMLNVWLVLQPQGFCFYTQCRFLLLCSMSVFAFMLNVWLALPPQGFCFYAQCRFLLLCSIFKWRLCLKTQALVPKFPIFEWRLYLNSQALVYKFPTYSFVKFLIAAGARGFNVCSCKNVAVITINCNLQCCSEVCDVILLVSQFDAMCLLQNPFPS
jgi:hypothetical protein